MSPHALADDLAGGDVERGEQRRRAVALVVVRHRSGAALLHRQARLRAVERLDLALLVDRETPAPCPADRDRGRRCPVTFSTNCLSFDSLKVFARCGFRPCAAQMRCTLAWLRPTALASLRADQCVPAGGFSCSVISTTRLIIAASKASFDQAASHRVAALRCPARRSAAPAVGRSLGLPQSLARSPSHRSLPPTSRRSVHAKPASVAYSGPPPNSPAVPDPQVTARCQIQLPFPETRILASVENPFVSAGTLESGPSQKVRSHILAFDSIVRRAPVLAPSVLSLTLRPLPGGIEPEQVLRSRRVGRLKPPHFERLNWGGMAPHPA